MAVPQLRPPDVGILAGGLLAMALTVAGLRVIPGVSATTAALALLLVVLLTATYGRLWIATITAALATLALNYFFVPPVGTLSVADLQNWIALLTFLATAVIASTLSSAAQRRAREREAAELARQKAEFTATLLTSLSHDIRTPLTAIRVAVENLRETLSPEERQRQSSAAVAEIDRLNHLFQDVLDMARIDAAAVDVQRQWVTPADVVDAAAAHVRHAMDGHPFEIEADDEIQVNIDPRVASVALSHLLENAARYSPRDQVVRVQARADSNGLHVSVTDQGAGLDPDEIERLFERFYRGRVARTLAPGTGMGLALTRGLLNAVGGRVWAESVSPRGARFAIEVPGPQRHVTT